MVATNSLEYLHLQMRLEGIRLAQDRLMLPLDPQGDDIPLTLLGQTSDGCTVMYFSAALSADLQKELAFLADGIRFPNVEIILGTLRSHSIQSEVRHSKTYVFPEHFGQAEVGTAKCLPKNDSEMKVLRFEGLADHVFAIESGGLILSACVSVRRNTECAEAWVFTTPDHRRRGLGQLVTTAWAKNMIQLGIIPFYKHIIENVASAGLAIRLGLIQVFEEIGIFEKRSVTLNNHDSVGDCSPSEIRWRLLTLFGTR